MRRHLRAAAVATASKLETQKMPSQDRVIDLLRAFVKEEAPDELWQVVSTDISNVLRKIVAVSAECQRAKLELHHLKKHVQHLEEIFCLPAHMRMVTVSSVQDSAENVEPNAAVLPPRQPDGVFLAPGRTARLTGVVDRPFLHWCKVCNELWRSKHADLPRCIRPECRSPLWRRGCPGKDSTKEPEDLEEL